VLLLTAHALAEPVRVALAVDQRTYDGGETGHRPADTAHLLGHVTNQHQGLGITGGRRVDHVRETRRGQGRILAPTGVGQCGWVLQTAQHGVGDDLVFFIEPGEDLWVLPAGGDVSERPHQVAPAVLLGTREQRGEFGPPFGVAAGLGRLPDELGMGQPDLFMAVGELRRIFQPVY